MAASKNEPVKVEVVQGEGEEIPVPDSPNPALKEAAEKADEVKDDGEPEQHDDPEGFAEPFDADLQEKNNEAVEKSQMESVLKNTPGEGVPARGVGTGVDIPYVAPLGT